MMHCWEGHTSVVEDQLWLDFCECNETFSSQLHILHEKKIKENKSKKLFHKINIGKKKKKKVVGKSN